MGRPFRFLVALILGLALVTWLASTIVRRTTRDWFEKDVSLRARLAVSGAREALISHWSKDQKEPLRDLLTEITRDERIMAAAACSSDRILLARTKDYPEPFGCAEVSLHVHPVAGGSASDWTAWQSFVALPGGSVHVSAIPVLDGDRALGFVVLVHDLSFVERREAKTQLFLLLAFGFLALAASAVTIVAARVSWRGWSRELQAPSPGRLRAARIPADPARRSRARGPHRRREGDRPRRRRMDAAAPQADAEPLPARREGRHPRQPRALHPRAARGRRHRRACIRRAAS